jgi:hypothetical protein
MNDNLLVNSGCSKYYSNTPLAQRLHTQYSLKQENTRKKRKIYRLTIYVDNLIVLHLTTSSYNNINTETILFLKKPILKSLI